MERKYDCDIRSIGSITNVIAYVILMFTNNAIGFNVDTKSAHIFTGPPNSYFGYSVAILKNSLGTWLLVGAPRANDSSLSGVHQPGAVFQCNWQYRSSCQPIFIDHIGNEKQTIPKAWKNITLMHHKDDQFLGASIDVNVNGDREITICAPRWIEKRFSVQGMLLMNGLCYRSDKELHFTESSALPALEYWKKQIHADGFYVYGMGSLGMAAKYSQNGKFSVIGAPGLNDWSGGFAFVDGSESVRPRVMSVPYKQHNNSYFGMSITTARLSKDDIFTIMGGPKSGPAGKIMAYNNNKFQLLFVKEGEQFGSSFGSSVCAVDLNDDGLDDLVVGAPLYTDEMDEGRVYVFINREFFNLELITPVLSGSNTRGARFGTAIANLGDLNGDGCEDIAVGAPYEEDSGVVYIYNGAKSGMHFKPSQRIVGKDLSSDLKTFGWSFSRPWDVDSNHYKDFAVGSFESNKVVLLRTRSVFDLYADLEVTPSLLNTNGRATCTYRGKPWHCLEAKICLRYTGLNLPPSTEVNITLQLDTLERHRGERSRLFARDDKGREVSSVNQLVTLRLGRLLCIERYKVYVRRSRDVLTPLKLELEYNIASESIGIASLCTICPIRNIYNPSIVHDMAHFVSDCGDDNKCHADISLHTHPVFDNRKSTFVIDDNPNFDLEIVVTNSNETSYFTVVTLEYPSFVDFSSIRILKGMNDVLCMKSDSDKKNTSTTAIECEIVYPLEKGAEVTLLVKFYAHGIPYEVHDFDVAASASTASEELPGALHNNAFTVTIPVFMESKLELSGVSLPGQAAVTPRFSTELPTLPVSHFYTLRNLGPSPVPHAQLTLSIPQFYGLEMGKVNVETAPVAESSHVPVECSEVLGVESSSQSQVEKPTSKDSTKFMTCNSNNCTHIQCYIGLMRKYEAVYINVSLSIKQDILKVMKVSDQIGFISSGWLEEPDYSSYYSLHFTHNVTIGTMVVYAWQSPGAGVLGGVPWWVLFTSVVSGVMLLYLITVMLWKCGFFKRKKKEELQMLIAASEAEREILNVDSLSASSSDIMVLPSADNSLMFTSTMLNHNNNHHHLNHHHHHHSLLHQNNNNDSIAQQVGGHFNDGHSVSTLHRRNYHFEDVPAIHDDLSSCYSHPRNSRISGNPGFMEHNHTMSSPPRRLESFNSLPRPEPVRSYNQQQQQYYLEPPPSRGDIYINSHNTMHSRARHTDHNSLRIAPPPSRRMTAPQAFNNEMYLEPVESRG